MTRYGIEKRKLQHEATKASAAAKSAEAAERDSRTREKESVSKRLANMASGIGSIARGAGGLAGGIAAINDPSWYKKTGASEQTARLASNPGPGTKLPDNFLAQNPSETIPAVMALSIVHTIGKATGLANEPANYAAAYLQSQLRRYNSRSGTEYDPSDLMMLQIFGASFRAELEDIRFCIGAYNTFSASHKLLAKLLIEAKGFDYAVFESNRARIITAFNEVAIRANFIPTIKSLSVVQRWKFLAQLCIRDARTQHGSYYIFKNNFRPEYDPENSIIKFLARSSNPVTELTSMLTAVTNVTDSASMIVMLSDIKGAISENEFEETPLVYENYQIVLNESREMIDQIHNAVLPPLVDFRTVNNGTGNNRNSGQSIRTVEPDFVVGEYGAFAIYQAASGYLAQGAHVRQAGPTYVDEGICLAPYFDANGNPTVGTGLPEANDVYPTPLDFDKDDISTDDILVASRLVTTWIPGNVVHNYSGSNQNADVWKAQTYGTEIVTSITFVSVNNGTGGSILFTHMTGLTNANTWTSIAGGQYGAALMNLMHWAPRYYACDDFEYADCNYVTLHWDMGRLVPYSDQAQRDINYMCVLSEFSLEDVIFKKVA